MKLPENLHIYTKEDMVVVNKSFSSGTYEDTYEIYIADDFIFQYGVVFEFENYSRAAKNVPVGAIVNKNNSIYTAIHLMPEHLIPTPGENNEKK